MIEIVATLANFGLAILGWAVLHFMWQGALLGGVLELALIGLRRARPVVRERVALVGLVLLLLIFGATVARIGAGALADLRAGIEPRPRADDGARPIPSTLVASLGAIAPFVGLAWLTLVVMGAIQLAGSFRGLRRLREGAIPLHTGDIAAMLPDLARRFGLRRTVSIRVSPAVDVPTLAGWRSPVILLPADSVHVLPVDALAGVVAHELAHVRRHDTVVQACLAGIRALLVLHPCTHRLVHIAECERERCCDDAALEAGTAPMQYARALVQLERLRPRSMSLAVAAARGPLRDRVQRIVRPVPALASGRAWGIAIAGVGLASVLGHYSVRASPARDLDVRPVQHAATRFAAHRAEFARHHHGHHGSHQTSHPSDAADHRRIVLRDVTHAPEPNAP